MSTVDFFPIYDGMQESSSKITKLPSYGDGRDRVFQFDKDYDRVLSHKKRVIWAKEEKFFQYDDRLDLNPINRYIAETLAKEYPTLFTFANKKFGKTPYWVLVDNTPGRPVQVLSSGANQPVAMFCELAAIIQEDLIVMTDRGDGTDYVSAIYLTMPSDWGAEYAIGESFEDIHAKIPRIKSIMPNPNRLVRMMISSPFVFERIGAVNFRDGCYLARHQDDVEPVKFDPENPKLFLRYERQTTKGFPEINSFLLTVKAYFENCDNPDPKKRQAIINAFRENNPKANAAKFIEENREAVLNWLEG